MEKLAELQVSNFRAVKSADIELNGVTVVSGINGSGKSTLAKLLYYIFHNANEYDKLADEEYKHRCMPYMEAIGQLGLESGDRNSVFRDFRYRRSLFYDYDYDFGGSLTAKIAQARSIINKNIPTFEKLEESDPKNYNRLKMILSGTLKKNPNDDHTLRELIALLFQRLDDETRSLHNNESQRPYSLLRNRITNEFDTGVSSAVTLNEYNIPLFGKQVKQVPIPHYIKKVALFDTPMIFGMPIDYNQPVYWKEINKLAMSKPERGYKRSINNKLKDILQGEVYYDSSNYFDRGFKFKDNIGREYDLLDCATGIKTFSMLQMLLKNRFIAEDTLMILDEPETNLHPQWSVELANLIVMIHKRIGTKFFITSHSTDMVSSLLNISSKEKSLDDLTFYIAERADSKGQTYIYRNLKNDIEPIFESFNKSYEKQDEYSK